MNELIEKAERITFDIENLMAAQRSLDLSDACDRSMHIGLSERIQEFLDVLKEHLFEYS